jgi:hypothetical protein
MKGYISTEMLIPRKVGIGAAFESMLKHSVHTDFGIGFISGYDHFILNVVVLTGHQLLDAI